MRAVSLEHREIMIKVYILQHSIPRGDHADEKLIGAYSSQIEAERAISRLKDKPGFRDPKGEFTIDAYELNKDHWSEGFGVE